MKNELMASVNVLELPPITLSNRRAKQIKDLSLHIERWLRRANKLQIHYCLELQLKVSGRWLRYHIERSYAVVLGKNVSEISLKSRSYRFRGHVLRIYPVIEYTASLPTAEELKTEDDMLFIVRHQYFEL